MNNIILLLLVDALKHWETEPLVAADKLVIAAEKIIDIAKTLRDSAMGISSAGSIGDRVIVKVINEHGEVKQTVDTGS